MTVEGSRTTSEELFYYSIFSITVGSNGINLIFWIQHIPNYINVLSYFDQTQHTNCQWWKDEPSRYWKCRCWANVVFEQIMFCVTHLILVRKITLFQIVKGCSHITLQCTWQYFIIIIHTFFTSSCIDALKFCYLFIGIRSNDVLSVKLELEVIEIL